ncbi:hypothetical protein BBP40_009473 [Aspergillus hancockii]|nr:hypothetical protein BBP40_009473 [Aspergillus hancockii]
MPPLSTTYQQSMRNHPYGYALYEPESSQTLQPGSCGYLTPLGQWTPLLGVNNKPIHLGDPSSLSENNLTPFPHFYPAPSDKRCWGPKTSAHTRARKVELEAGLSALPSGIPASIGAMYKFSSGNGFGAVLMTKAPVIKEFLYGTTTFRQWSKENSATIVSKWPDVTDRGLIIVTSVYSTELAMINAWTEHEREISIGFRGGVIEIGELGPSSSWYTANGDSGWVTSGEDGSGDRKVVFFGGLYFRYRRLAAILPSEHAFSAASVEKAKFRDTDPAVREFRTVVQGEEGQFDVFVSSEDVGEMVELPVSAEEGEDDDF